MVFWNSKTVSCIALSFLFTIVHQSAAEISVFDVVKLGAKPDGKTDSTKSFKDAWAAACGSIESAEIHVPPGRYLVKKIVFNGPCKNSNTTIRIEGTLVAPWDYNIIGSAKYWIQFQSVTGVSIYGGTLDGRGKSLWACKHAKHKCPEGAASLAFKESKDIIVDGLKSVDSQMFHIVIKLCQNVNMRGVMITAPGNSPNTDGIHVQLSSDVTITHSGIKTGDDCISIGAGTRNLWIEHITCGPGHGISIGSLGKTFDEQGVRNVTVKTVVFTGTQNGMRIKAWGRPSNGFVEDVLFQDVIMNNVRNPVVIDQNYCPGHRGCHNKVSGVKISHVTYKNIQGTSASPVAVRFDCSTKHPCIGIKLENVKLRHRNHHALASCANSDALASCANADGSVHGVVQPIVSFQY